MDEQDKYTDWIAPLQSAVHDIYQSVYSSIFNSLLLKGILVEDARKRSIDFVEDVFSLKPGSFHPSSNLQDDDSLGVPELVEGFLPSER